MQLNSNKQRKIIHVDMDAFYASVEIRDRPELAEQAVVIGGRPDSRSVVCTANYRARKFGIHAAMSCAEAYRRCPAAVFLPPNFSKYKHESQIIRAIFRRYTDLIEPLSLDEAYLDVSDCTIHPFATKIATMIKAEIRQETGLSASAGVSCNKMLAKIASDYRKPNGLTVVLPSQIEDFLRAMPLRKIPGVGPATEARLAQHGLRTCADIWAVPQERLQAVFGERLATWLGQRARGLDPREVKPFRERKSLGQETTLAVDVLDLGIIEQELGKIISSLHNLIKTRHLTPFTLTLKVKYNDFTSITRSFSVSAPITQKAEIQELAGRLLLRTEAGSRKIRLLGLSVSNFRREEEDRLSYGSELFSTVD